MLCNILEMPDNNINLETMRSFRKNILQKDEKYKSLLVEYDILGPRIAEYLNNDPIKERIAEKYLNIYIIPITTLINEKNYEMAINLYKNMTIGLSFVYDLDHITISKEEIKNANIKESGHGIYKVKKITPNV
ncbi:MAG: hypothetical protein IKL65_06000 [Bacilli bacterium]|nr:hypothetical protein [Bacilli bacterium]